MYAVERQAWIVKHTRSSGRVEVSSVCDELEVAPETIRRDLKELERQGLVRRVHGGAVPVDRLGFEEKLARRSATNHDEKVRIADAALELLHNAESVYFDDGSTVQVLAERLYPTRPLTVVTNALPTASLLAGRPNVEVIVLGGRLRSRTTAALGHWATQMLADLVIDLAVLGANGVSKRGLTCPDPAVAAVKSAACAAANRRVLLADHSKLGAESFCRFADLADLDWAVTDRAAPSERVQEIHDAGVEVLLA